MDAGMGQSKLRLDLFTVITQGGLGGTLGTVCFMIFKKYLQVDIFTSRLGKSNEIGQCSLQQHS